MSTPRNVYRGTTVLLSWVMVLLGVSMLVRTLAGGGGVLSIGVLLGVLFIAAGAGRAYLALRPGRARRAP
jgi:hypothetical protein